MGRPKIGTPVSINLGRQQQRVDDYAQRENLSRAAAARQLMEIGFRLEWDYDWWGKFETYDWRGDGPEYFKGTKAVHLRLGNSHDRIPMIANVTRWPEAKIIRGFIYLGWRADEQSYDDDNEADTTAIERYRNGERDAPTDDPWSDYYVDDDPDDCEEPPPPWLEILEGESSLPPGL